MPNHDYKSLHYLSNKLELTNTNKTKVVLGLTQHAKKGSSLSQTLVLLFSLKKMPARSLFISFYRRLKPNQTVLSHLSLLALEGPLNKNFLNPSFPLKQRKKEPPAKQLPFSFLLNQRTLPYLTFYQIFFALLHSTPTWPTPSFFSLHGFYSQILRCFHVIASKWRYGCKR